MSPARALRAWLLVSVGLLGVMLAWIISDQLLWSTGGTPEEVVPHLQRHTRLMRYGIGVCAGIVIIGMTRWVYWALCSALDTVQNAERAIQQMDTQALRDFMARLETEDGGDA